MGTCLVPRRFSTRFVGSFLTSFVAHLLYSCLTPRVLRSSLRSSLRCSSFGLTHSSRRACDSCPSSPRTGAGERAPARYTSSSLGFRHFVHTALRRASAGTGPAASVSRSTARYTHLASLVPLGRVPKGRSLPRSLRSLPSLVPSSHSPLVTRHPYPPTTPRRVSGTALGHPRRGGAFSSRREPRSPVGAHLLPTVAGRPGLRRCRERMRDAGDE